MTAREKAADTVSVQAAINKAFDNLDAALHGEFRAVPAHCTCGHPVGLPAHWCGYCLTELPARLLTLPATRESPRA